jgi:hypothetical protein
MEVSLVVVAEKSQQVGRLAQVGHRPTDVDPLAAGGLEDLVGAHDGARLEPLDAQGAVEAEIGGDDEQRAS